MKRRRQAGQQRGDQRQPGREGEHAAVERQRHVDRERQRRQRARRAATSCRAPAAVRRRRRARTAASSRSAAAAPAARVPRPMASRTAISAAARWRARAGRRRRWRTRPPARSKRSPSAARGTATTVRDCREQATKASSRSPRRRFCSRPLALERAADRVQLRGSLRHRDARLQAAADDTATRALRFVSAAAPCDSDRGAMLIGIHMSAATTPVPWNPSDATPTTVNGWPLSVQRPADDGGIAVEPPRPEAMAQTTTGLAPGCSPSLGAEQPPGGGNDAEHGEVVRRHERGRRRVSAPRIAAGAAKAHRLRKSRVGVHAGERRRRGGECRGSRDTSSGRSRRRPAGAADVDETLGSATPARRPEQQRVGDGEDRGRGADADGERQRGGQREERIAAEQPQRAWRISRPRVVEPRRTSARRDGVPSSARRRQARAGRRDAPRPATARALEVVLEQREMGRESRARVGLRAAGRGTAFRSRRKNRREAAPSLTTR